MEYGNISDNNPKQIIALVTMHLQLVKLRQEVQKRLKYKPDLEKDLKKFTKLLRKKPKACQAYRKQVNRQGPTKVSSVHPRNGAAKDSDKSSDHQERKIEEPQICWYQTQMKNGIWQKLKSCQNRTKKKKRQYMRLWKENGFKKITNLRVSGVGAPVAKWNCAPINIFTAIFGGKAEELVSADNRAYSKIIGNCILELVITAGMAVRLDTLSI